VPLQLSYNALTGLPTRGSIRFSGTVHGRDIRILMDGGSSDNFIHPALVKRLAIPWYKVPSFKVQVGSGELLKCDGQVRNVPIKIQQHIITVNAFVLPIASEELVLGDIWLETMDTHLVNYKQKFITFMHNDQLITLQGELHPIIDQAQFHQFRRLQTTKAILALYTLQNSATIGILFTPSGFTCTYRSRIGSVTTNLSGCVPISTWIAPFQST